jgi:hypothetical protein
MPGYSPAYSHHYPAVTPGGGGGGPTPSGQTIGQVFQQKGLWQWWTQNGGIGTNPFNGVTEKGIDYANTFGTPIGAPIGGMVVRIVHNNNSICDVVEIQASDGSVMLYQHINTRVRVGQSVGCGDIVGTENGLPIDQYSTGPHIEVRYCQPNRWSPSLNSWIEPWVNPFGLFSQFSNAQSGSTGIGPCGSAGIGFGSTPGTPVVGPPIIKHLASNADVTAFLMTLDELGTMVNPFTAASAAAQVDTIQGSLPIVGAVGPSLSFSDPISWLTDFGTACIMDATAFFFRAFLVLIGVILVIKVVTTFVDFGSYASDATGIIAKVAGMAA